MAIVERLLAPVVELRPKEALTAILLFAYSFLAMAVWNTIKPLTRSQFIRDLGADNLPYVLLAAGLLVGVLMAGYAWLMARLPRRWALPIVQAGMAGLLIVCWLLLQTGAAWVSVAFYVLGLIFGLLLISQFWTVANLVYDPRQAKRLFGFIGGGAPLGGMAGSAFAAIAASRLGSLNLLLPSAVVMLLAAAVTVWIIRREGIDLRDGAAAASADTRGVGAGEALRLLRESSHLKLIALVIGFASIGAAIIEQQLNMAAEAQHGAGATDAITAALAWVGVGTSGIGLVIQVWLTSRIHRHFGVGFALMVLPVMLGTTAVVMLLNAALWAPALARIADQSLRYTLDKTSREILFLPLPDAIKVKAKPFVDVTVDRLARAAAALLLILLVQPWALNLDWQTISYASLTIMGLWLAMALRARRSYLTALRQSIERQEFVPDDVRLSGADLTTVETLVQELAHVDARRVLVAIGVLELLDKRHLVTPLLLRHESPAVRERALRAMAATRAGATAEWLAQIRRLLDDDDEPGVRAAAMRVIGAFGNDDAMARARAMATEPNARIRATAAIVLASGTPDDVALAEATLVALSSDAGEHGRAGRYEAAVALREIADARFQRLLIPLLADPAADVAEAALRSVEAAGITDFLFAPALVTLLGHRQLKSRARDVLVSIGEPIVDVLAYFLADRDEPVWVRRHIPGTLARIPSQRSVDALVAALSDPDAFLRFKVITGLQRLRRNDRALSIARTPVETQAVREANRYFQCFTAHDSLFRRGGHDTDSLLAHALLQKMDRARHRIYGLLALIEPWQDVAAAEGALERGDARRRSSASEYLDNLMPSELRRWLMPVLEDLPYDQKLRRGNGLLGAHPAGVDDTLRQLVADEDEVLAAAAVDLVRQSGRWELGRDVEHVLFGGETRHAFVREAAAAALAARGGRTGPDRQESLTTAAIADRLRELPLFATVTVDELFRIAGALRQERQGPGTVLAAGGDAPRVVHLLLEGAVAVVTAQGRRVMNAPAVIGLVETLRDRAIGGVVCTNGPAITAALTADDLHTLLADNAQLLTGLFAMVAGGTEGADGAVEHVGAADLFRRFAAGGVAPGEKVVVLEYVPLLAHLGAEEAPYVADLAQPIALVPGATLFDANASPALWIVLSGTLALEAQGREPVLASAGDVVGTRAALAGQPLGRAGRVREGGMALRIGRDGLFDLIADRPGLVSQLIAGLVRMAGPRVERPAPVAAAAAELTV